MTEATNALTPVVEMRGVSKYFGQFKANDKIDLTLNRGEIHAILGENGAGKTTLMNVLYGLLQPSEGEILINGEPVLFTGPNDAIAKGIGMVHQHFMLIPPFTVSENIVLGAEPMKNGQVDLKTARKSVRAISERYGLDVDVDAKIENISVGMQQRTEILKVLYRGADVLILDEPTASLTPQEIDELIKIMHNLTAEGKSILLITHKLKEIMSAADRCTIIRRGEKIASVSVSETTEAELAEMMVGRKVEFKAVRKEMEPGDVILSVKDLVVHDYRRLPMVDHLSLDVSAGEIVGLAGVDGNGQSELVEALTGLRKTVSGNVFMNGQDISHASVRERFLAGVSSIPEDRQKYGLILDFTVAENLVLQNYAEPQFAKRGKLRFKAISDYASRMIEQFDIRPSDAKHRAARSLSGGNQQKVIIAREVSNDKSLLIAVNPTRGLDAGAVEYVHRFLIGQRNKGKAVLLISFELDEIMSLSDRIEVLFKGKISGSLAGIDADERTLGLMMAGGKTHAD